MADLTITAGNDDVLTIGTVGVGSTGSGVETFATATALLASTRDNGHIGYATNTGAHYLRELGAWVGPVQVAIPDIGVKVYATAVALLAASLDDGRIAYASDTDAHYFRQAGAWAGPIPTASVGGGVEVFAADSSLLAASRTDGALAYATDTAKHYQREASTWGRMMGAKYVGKTLAQIITIVGANRETVYIDRTVAAGAGSTVTVPRNLRLVRIDDGKISIAAGQTLIFQSMPISDASTLFSFADATALVQFATGGGGVVLPEWFGAVGDYVTHDGAAWQRMCDAVTGALNNEMVIDIRGRHYYIDSQVVVAPGTTGRLWILGQGAYIKAGAIHGGVFKFGNLATSRKLYWSEVQGLTVQRDDAVSLFSDSAAYQIDRSDFSAFKLGRLDNFHYGVHVTGEGGNSTTFDRVSISACTEGIGGGPDADNFNNVSINGGKIQQNGIGLHLKGSQVRIGTSDPVDFSLNTVSAIKLENCGFAQISIYTEQCGPATDSNDAKIIHLINSAHISIKECVINGAYLGSSTANCGHGIYMEGCQDVHIDNNSFVKMEKKDIHADAACDGPSIEIGPLNDLDISGANDFPAGAPNAKLVRVSDLTLNGVNNKLATYLFPRNTYAGVLSGTPQNVCTSPNDFSVSPWTPKDGASVAGTTLGPDGATAVQVLSMPNTIVAGDTSKTSRFDATFDFGSGLNGKTIVVRLWYKPISVLNSSIYLTHRGMLQIVRTNAPDADQTGLPGCFDGSDGWLYYERRWPAPTTIDNLHTASIGISSSYYAGDGVQMAVCKFQIFATDNVRKHVALI